MNLFGTQPSPVSATDEMITCAKCGKQKKKSDGHYMLEGTTFCCRECCGDPSKNEHKDKAANVCEFC